MAQKQLEKTNRIIVGLGSNHDPETNVSKAIANLTRLVHVVKISRFTKTPSLDDPLAPPYLNGVLLIETPLDQIRLKETLKEVEANLRRKEVQEKSGRITIDLDLLVWNGEVIDKSFLRLPFLANVVAEIDPSIRQKVSKQ